MAPVPDESRELAEVRGAVPLPREWQWSLARHAAEPRLLNGGVDLRLDSLDDDDDAPRAGPQLSQPLREVGHRSLPGLALLGVRQLVDGLKREVVEVAAQARPRTCSRPSWSCAAGRLSSYGTPLRASKPICRVAGRVRACLRTRPTTGSGSCSRRKTLRGSEGLRSARSCFCRAGGCSGRWITPAGTTRGRCRPSTT